MARARSRSGNALTTVGPKGGQSDVIVRARRQLAQRVPYAYYFKDIQLEYDRSVLTLRGRVPTHALKSMLETTLSHLEGVERIDNQVDVISADGLSSIHPK
jgi:hypothetical protein